MKVIDVLRFNRELLEKIARAGIRLDDIRYIDLFSDYMAMKSQGEKITYIVSILAFRYSISERKVYSLIKHLQNDSNSDAV